jgi:hypothetical protein
MAGAAVEPGDLLVGISTPKDPDNPTPEDRLLLALFGEKAPQRRDVSLRWSGQQKAVVLGVHISRTWFASQEFAERPGRVNRLDKLHQGEQTRISVSLASSDPMETGDVLHGPDQTRAVVCGTHDISGTDVLVSADHPWAPGTPGTTVELRLRPDERSRSAFQVRSIGAYHRVTELPAESSAEEPGQPLRLADIAWLLRHGATEAAYELYALRADCVDERLELYKQMLRGQTSLQALRGAPSDDRFTPSQTLRNWDRLLRSACVAPVLVGDRLSFRAIGDDEILATSNGEVGQPQTLNTSSGQLKFGGLDCQRTFGPLRTYVCGCGTRHRPADQGTRCEHCGVEVTVSHVRRERMGHIELAVPVVHPWYRERLSRALGLNREALAEVVDGQRRATRDLTGAEAIRFLLDQRGHTSIPDAVLHRLPVLPAGLRPTYVHHGETLNDRYAKIVRQNVLAHHQLDNGVKPSDVNRAGLQHAINDLFQATDASVADLSVVLPGLTGGVRQRLFDRPVDYSARTTVVAASTGNIDRALLPDRLASLLLTPVVARRLVDAGESPHFKAAEQVVRERVPQAWPHLQAACQEATILVSVPGTQWPMFAVHVGLTADLSLKLDAALFDHLGWHRLGAHVRIFPLMTEEAAAQAQAALLPSALLEPTTVPASLLSLDQQQLPDEIVRMISTRESVQLGELDRFLLFSADRGRALTRNGEGHR